MSSLLSGLRSAGLSLGLMSLIVGGLAAEAAGQSLVAGWHSDLDEARRASRETGKPIFLVFRCVR